MDEEKKAARAAAKTKKLKELLQDEQKGEKKEQRSMKVDIDYVREMFEKRYIQSSTPLPMFRHLLNVSHKDTPLPHGAEVIGHLTMGTAFYGQSENETTDTGFINNGLYNFLHDRHALAGNIEDQPEDEDLSRFAEWYGSTTRVQVKRLTDMFRSLLLIFNFLAEHAHVGEVPVTNVPLLVTELQRINKWFEHGASTPSRKNVGIDEKESAPWWFRGWLVPVDDLVSLDAREDSEERLDDLLLYAVDGHAITIAEAGAMASAPALDDDHVDSLIHLWRRIGRHKWNTGGTPLASSANEALQRLTEKARELELTPEGKHARAKFVEKIEAKADRIVRFLESLQDPASVIDPADARESMLDALGMDSSRATREDIIRHIESKEQPFDHDIAMIMEVAAGASTMDLLKKRYYHLVDINDGTKLPMSSDNVFRVLIRLLLRNRDKWHERIWFYTAKQHGIDTTPIRDLEERVTVHQGGVYKQVVVHRPGDPGIDFFPSYSRYLDAREFPNGFWLRVLPRGKTVFQFHDEHKFWDSVTNPQLQEQKKEVVARRTVRDLYLIDLSDVRNLKLLFNFSFATEEMRKLFSVFTGYGRRSLEAGDEGFMEIPPRFWYKDKPKEEPSFTLVAGANIVDEVKTVLQQHSRKKGWTHDYDNGPTPALDGWIVTEPMATGLKSTYPTVESKGRWEPHIVLFDAKRDTEVVPGDAKALQQQYYAASRIVNKHSEDFEFLLPLGLNNTFLEIASAISSVSTHVPAHYDRETGQWTQAFNVESKEKLLSAENRRRNLLSILTGPKRDEMGRPLDPDPLIFRSQHVLHERPTGKRTTAMRLHYFNGWTYGRGFKQEGKAGLVRGRLGDPWGEEDYNVDSPGSDPHEEALYPLIPAIFKVHKNRSNTNALKALASRITVPARMETKEEAEKSTARARGPVSHGRERMLPGGQPQPTKFDKGPLEQIMLPFLGRHATHARKKALMAP